MCSFFEISQTYNLSSFQKHDGPEFRSCIVGPTCCDIDILHEDYMLPQLDIGDWMYFSDMGVDSLCLATNFNGMMIRHPQSGAVMI